MYNDWVKMSYLKSILWALSFCAVMFLSALPAYAIKQQLNIDNIPEIEPIELMPEAEFEEKTKPIVHLSDQYKSLAYSLRIPADWIETNSYADVTKDNSVLGSKVLGILTRFVSPPDSVKIEQFFTVEAMQLTYEIGVKNWFIHHVLTNGLSLERMTIKNRQELEAIYIELRKDTTYIVRVKAIINGSKIVVAKYYLPQQHFNENKIMQAQAIDSFSLTYPEKRTIEDLETVGFLSQSYFDYPPSWKLKVAKINSIDHMKARLQRKVVDGILEGQIDINLSNKLSVNTRAEIIKEFRNNFSIKRYNVEKFIEAPEMEYHQEMSFGMTQVYELKSKVPNMMEYELWVSVMEGEDYYYLISLVTPARDEEFYKWARNIETYKLVVKSMRRHDRTRKLFEFVK